MKTHFEILKNRSYSLVTRIYLLLGSTLLLGLAAATGALIFFAWLTDEMLEGDTKVFDESVRSFVHQFAAPAVTWAMQVASFAGSTVFLVTFGLAFFAGLLWLKRKRAAVLFAVTMIGSTILLVTLKTSFARARPEPYFDILLPTSYSFPSGHALSSFCFYGTLAAIVTARLKSRLRSVAIWLAAGLLTLTIGLSRVYLGVHFPSDVLAGYAAALVWVVTVAAGDRLFLQPTQV